MSGPTLDEVIWEQFEATYAGCDPAVDENPRKYSHGWFAEGVFFGIKLGTQIGQDVRSLDARKEWERTWALGYSQALNYIIFAVSHLAISREYDVKTVHGGELMRELVIDMLEASIRSDQVRRMAQQEVRRNEATDETDKSGFSQSTKNGKAGSNGKAD